jgi:hypothetical protein
MTSHINNVLLRLSKRAETIGREMLLQTFVDVGPLSALLASADHQIVYGRRGTGKTHAFAYISSIQEKAGNATAYVDLRNIGSSGGIYADTNRSIPERATCLLVDTLSAVHERLLEYFLNAPNAPDLSHSGPALDALSDAITEVMVVGSVEIEEKSSQSRMEETKADIGTTLALQQASIAASLSSASNSSNYNEERLTKTGAVRHHVNFGSTGAAFRRIAELLVPHHLWVLLDEWSSLPMDLQPYLADLLRRSLLPTTGITVKIAAIDQRSRFQLRLESGDYLGIEVGADAAADINLDDFMVFDNDADRAKAFFTDLVFHHAQAIAKGTEDQDNIPNSATELVRDAFNTKRAFEEFVRASEGVPRDASTFCQMQPRGRLMVRLPLKMSA